MNARKGLISALLIALTTLFLVDLAAGALVSYGIPKDEQAVDDLLDRISKSLVKRHPIQPIGTSVAMPGGDVRILGLKFHVRGPLTREELRAVLIDCAQIFLSHVNTCEKVRPFLNHYPFSIEDIEMTLFVVDLTGRDVNAPHIGTVRFGYGNITYRILQDGEDGIPISKGEIMESYAEALEALKQQQGGPA